MQFRGLDLNLLIIFDSLMRTNSVSRSAEQLHLSQPGISSALKRLRDSLGDELLVLCDRRMVPTAYAESLWSNASAFLHAVDGFAAAPSGFDPATARRRFRLCTSDYTATALVAPLARALAAEAPLVQLDLLHNDAHSVRHLEQGDVDLIIVPEHYTHPALPSEILVRERYVIAGWAQNPLFAQPIDEAAFLGAAHVAVAVGYERTRVFTDIHLTALGKRPEAEVTAATFAMVPWLLVGTRRIALLQERLARIMAQHHDISIADVPFSFPTMTVVQQYHPARATDAGLAWLRGRLKGLDGITP